MFFAPSISSELFKKKKNPNQTQLVNSEKAKKSEDNRKKEREFYRLSWDRLAILEKGVDPAMESAPEALI